MLLRVMARSYSIVPEIPQSYIGNLYEFVYRSFLLPQKSRFSDISRSTFPSALYVHYSVLYSAGNKKLRVRVSEVEPISVSVEPLFDMVSEDEILQAREDVDVAVDIFESRASFCRIPILRCQIWLLKK
jgi:hypothetical protein